MRGFIGIDCSSKGVHFAILNFGGKLQGLFSFKSTKKEVDERFYEIAEQFEDFVEALTSDYVGSVEKPIYVQSFAATSSLSQMVGMVKLTLQNQGIYFFLVDNKSWKKEIVGNGNSTKEQIKEFAMKKWELGNDLDQDFYDAVCISEFGRRKFEKGIEEKRSREEEKSC